MSKLRLILSCGNYDRTRALIDGTVQPEGIEVEVISPMSHKERHTRMMRQLEFDVCELSTAQFLSAKTRGLPLTAVPAFPYRAFRHGYIFVNAQAGIDEPADLIGKRVGAVLFINTAAMWVRGTLEDDYGVPAEQMIWITEAPEEVPDWRPPQGLRLQRVAAGNSVEDLLLTGEIDAVIYPSVLPSIGNGDQRVRRLFPNYKSVEMDYFSRTGLYPIMHTVVIKDSVLKHNPWVAASVLNAFNRAKDLAYEHYRSQAPTMLAWFDEAVAEQAKVMGPDPWAYGIHANRHTVEKMVEYACRQGLIESKPSIEGLFAPEAWEPGD
ncbi:MAG: ABC transporter substrate-binding protein [Chloroflexi bacterium]|nr:ABC transporter substrate-binding protein [Chloroflexota bacterium]